MTFCWRHYRWKQILRTSPDLSVTVITPCALCVCVCVCVRCVELSANLFKHLHHVKAPAGRRKAAGRAAVEVEVGRVVVVVNSPCAAEEDARVAECYISLVML